MSSTGGLGAGGRFFLCDLGEGESPPAGEVLGADSAAETGTAAAPCAGTVPLRSLQSRAAGEEFCVAAAAAAAAVLFDRRSAIGESPKTQREVNQQLHGRNRRLAQRRLACGPDQLHAVQTCGSALLARREEPHQ